MNLETHLFFKTVSVSQFIGCGQPIPMLAEYNQFTFDEEDKIFKRHKATVPEILALCDDLKVLGKGDFKKLLKWRTTMLDYKEQLADEVKDESKKEIEEETKPEEEEEEEIDQELDQKLQELDKRKKKIKKRQSERKKKFQKKIDMKMVIPGDQLVTQDEEGLFQLSKIKNDLVLDSLIDAEPDIVLENEETNGEEFKDEDGEQFEKNEEYEISEEKGDYDAVMEDYLDEMYEEYVSHKLNRTKRIKIGKKQKKEKETEIEMDLNDFQENKRQKIEINFEPKVSGDVLSEDEMEDANTTNSLIVKETKSIPSSKRATIGFLNLVI